MSDDEARRNNPGSKSPIDIRLDGLMNRLTSYQVFLATKARALSSEFEKGVLASMLYDPKFDSWDLKPISSADLSKQKQELLKARSELGVLDEEIRKKINTHMEKISETSPGAIGKDATRFDMKSNMGPLSTAFG